MGLIHQSFIQGWIKYIHLGGLVLGQGHVDNFAELFKEFCDRLDGGVERQILDVDGARVLLVTVARHDGLLASNLNKGSLKVKGRSVSSKRLVASHRKFVKSSRYKPCSSFRENYFDEWLKDKLFVLVQNCDLSDAKDVKKANSRRNLSVDIVASWHNNQREKFQIILFFSKSLEFLKTCFRWTWYPNLLLENYSCIQIDQSK